jgi:hypothetical protein
MGGTYYLAKAQTLLRNPNTIALCSINIANIRTDLGQKEPLLSVKPNTPCTHVHDPNHQTFLGLSELYRMACENSSIFPFRDYLPLGIEHNDNRFFSAEEKHLARTMIDGGGGHV